MPGRRKRRRRRGKRRKASLFGTWTMRSALRWNWTSSQYSPQACLFSVSCGVAVVIPVWVHGCVYSGCVCVCVCVCVCMWCVCVCVWCVCVCLSVCLYVCVCVHYVCVIMAVMIPVSVFYLHLQ